jgi:hypothetical protein
MDPTPQPDTYEVVIRGGEPSRLAAEAARQCALHFGDCPFKIDERRCHVCLSTLGGSPRLWEVHVTAHAEPASSAPGSPDA